MILTLDQLNDACDEAVTNCSPYYFRAQLFLQILRACGCRPKEALDINLWSIVNPTTVQLAALKGNWPRTINLLSLPSDFVDAIDTQTNPFRSCYYRRYEYAFVRCWPYYPTTVGAKNIGTYVFRHRTFKQLFADGLTREQVRVTMGENTLAVSNGYIDSEIETA